MSFKKYSEYRDSKQDWFDSIPSHWSIEPCRSVFIERNERNDPLVNEDYLSLMANVGVLPYEEKGDVGNKKPEDLGKCKQVYIGDLVINSMNYGIGSYGLSKYRGVCSPVYIVLTPKKDKLEERFAFRILETKQFQKYAQSFGNGILEHRAAINWDILKIIGLPVPPIEEQQQILNFLDDQTSKIDLLIAEQENLIELLKEKRQALISSVVSKGLNPDVGLKDSGVEWLGQVPEHWEIKKLRTFTRILRGKFTHRPRNDPDFYDGEYPFIQTGDVAAAQKYITDFSQTLNERGISVSKEFPKNTLVMTIAANIGDVAILDFPAYFPDSIVGLIPDEKTNLVFLFYLIKSMKQALEMNATVSTQMNLNIEQIGTLTSVCPPIAEQEFIARFLDSEITKIDALTSEANRVIELLSERRTALLSAAVTGKIDVHSSFLK